VKSFRSNQWSGCQVVELNPEASTCAMKPHASGYRSYPDRRRRVGDGESLNRRQEEQRAVGSREAGNSVGEALLGFERLSVRTLDRYVPGQIPQQPPVSRGRSLEVARQVHHRDEEPGQYRTTDRCDRASLAPQLEERCRTEVFGIRRRPGQPPRAAEHTPSMQVEKLGERVTVIPACSPPQFEFGLIVGHIIECPRCGEALHGSSIRSQGSVIGGL